MNASDLSILSRHRVDVSLRKSEGKRAIRLLAAFLTLAAAGATKANSTPAAAPRPASAAGASPSTAPSTKAPGIEPGRSKQPAKRTDYSNMTIEELMNVDVISAAGRAERVSELAAVERIMAPASRPSFLQLPTRF